MADENSSVVEYRRQWYLKNKEVVKARSRAWSAANKERKAATDRAYREATYEQNKEAIMERQRQLRKRKPTLVKEQRDRSIEATRAREAAYRERNREICNERIREWKKRNPHAAVVYENKRRAAEIQAIPAWADLDAIAEIYKAARALGPGYHVDHIVPLIGKGVCGLHCEANLQAIPAAENLRKNRHRWPDMW